MKISKSIDKYLVNYSENESKDMDLLQKAYDYVIVIPFCNEDNDCLNTIFTHIDENLLIIIVVNSSISSDLWQINNTKEINVIKESSKVNTYINSSSDLLQFNNFNDILLIDRNSNNKQIPKENGVGLARKIGCDIALKLYTLGKIKFPWIFSTDADVILPRNYFSQQENDARYAAIVLDFEHVSEDKNLTNLQFLYDFKLHYYLAGINYSGSQYNYIPMGSTLIINMESYAQVRGFPKKNAGEDFYILNKLAKVKPVKNGIDGCIVKINSRFSNRVPFGTGPALLSIQQLESLDDYRYYHPQCFIELRKWQKHLDSMWENQQLVVKSPSDKNLQELYNFFGCKNIFKNSFAQITSKQRWQQFVQQWFDAFRTLKAVHFFDKKYARLNYYELLKNESFAKVSNSNLIKFINQNDKN